MTQQTSQGNYIRHLREYFSPRNQVFPDAKQLPSFFETNLLDQARVVKHFHNDPQANIKVFFYQYLKLCFQIENVDYESYIEKIYELMKTDGFEFTFNEQFTINESDKNRFQDEKTKKQFMNAQYKSLLVDFFELMNNGTMTIDIVLMQYPIMEEVLINFFRTIVMLAGVTDNFNSYIDKNQLFDFLSSFFSVDISSYEKCLKFVQSDIFVYEEDPHDIYMAFIKDQEEQVLQSYQHLASENTLKQQLGRNTFENNNIKQSDYELKITCQKQQANFSYAPSSTPNQSLRPRVKTIIKQSYIQGEFTDYTNIQQSSLPAKNLSQFARHSNMLQSLQQSNPNPQCYSYQPQQNEQENEKIYNLTNQQTQQPIQERNETIEQNKNVEFQEGLRRVASTDNNFLQKKGNKYSNGENQDGNNRQYHLGKEMSQPNLFLLNSGEKQVFSLEGGDSQLKNKDLEGYIRGLTATAKQKQTQQVKTKKNILQENEQNPQPKLPISNINSQQKQQPTRDPGFYPYQRYTQSNKEILNKSPQHIIQKQQLIYKPQIKNPTLLTSQQATTTTNKNVHNSTQKYKLQVTKQFTNSIVMKCMSQPYKTNVFRLRQKAREVRDRYSRVDKGIKEDKKDTMVKKQGKEMDIKKPEQVDRKEMGVKGQKWQRQETIRKGFNSSQNYSVQQANNKPTQREVYSQAPSSQRQQYYKRITPSPHYQSSRPISHNIGPNINTAPQFPQYTPYRYQSPNNHIYNNYPINAHYYPGK